MSFDASPLFAPQSYSQRKCSIPGGEKWLGKVFGSSGANTRNEATLFMCVGHTAGQPNTTGWCEPS